MEKFLARFLGTWEWGGRGPGLTVDCLSFKFDRCLTSEW